MSVDETYWPTCAGCGVAECGPESCHCTELCAICGAEEWAEDMTYCEWLLVPVWCCWKCRKGGWP